MVPPGLIYIIQFNKRYTIWIMNVVCKINNLFSHSFNRI